MVEICTALISLLTQIGMFAMGAIGFRASMISMWPHPTELFPLVLRPRFLVLPVPDLVESLTAQLGSELLPRR